MNNQRKFILIAAAVGIIAAFLPWFSVSVGMAGMDMGGTSINGFHGVGILYCLAIVAAGAVAAMGDQKALLDKNMRLVAIIGGAVSVIALVIWFINMKSSSAEGGMAMAMGAVKTSVGYGFYLAAVAALAVTIIPFYIKGADESFAGDLANLKSSVQNIQTNMATPAATATPTVTAAPAPPPAPATDRMAELEKLIAWRNEGKITEQEFEDLKAKIL